MPLLTPVPSTSAMSVPRLSVLVVLLAVCVPSVVLSAVSDVSDLLSLYASRSRSFPSHRDISAVHTLDAYVVYDGTSGVTDGALQPLSHFHPMSSRQFRVMDTATGLPTYTHHPSGSAVYSAAGDYQPFPSTVVLSFAAFGLDFHLPLRRVPSLWVSNASVVVRDGWDNVLSEVSPLDSSYWALDGDYLDDNWAVATLREDGRFHAVINHEGEVYQADPIEHFKPHMDDTHFHTMATHSQRGMAVYRHRDITQHDKRCGADSHVHDPDLDVHTHPIVLDMLAGTGNTSVSASSGSTSTGRRLLQIQANDEEPTAPNLVGMNIFSIFPNNPQRMPYSFVVDAGFYSLFNSVEDVQAALTAVVVSSNVILLKQTQIYVQINSITVMTQPNPSGGPNPWNQPAHPAGASGCANYDINTQLNDMNNYRSNYHPNQGAAHVLFTNCWPAPGIVGLSYIGWTCTADYAISVSSYNAPFWQTVVHEIGHTLGAAHTFATPTWAGGGIMDYYVDSRYPIGTGPYQFAPPNEAQMQYWVATDNQLSDFATFTQPYCQKDYVTVCGNGVVEPGEQCDDSTGCCTSTCQLASGAQCSGTSTCCTAQCAFAPSSVACGAGNGFCANGLCQLSSCPSTLPYCGLDPSSGGCRQSCDGAGLCSSVAWSFNNLNLPDGTVCNSDGGVCSAGQCATADPTGTNTITYAWTTGTWPTTCPCTGNETRSVSCVGTSGSTTAVYSDSYCAASGGSKPSSWQSCTVPASCFPYSWQYGSWSSCSQSCDGGVSTRTASCYWESSPPAPVASSYCSSLPQSTTVQTCNTANCTYQYVESTTFSACTASCGGGTQTRTPATQCQRSINGAWQTMPLSSCAAILHYTVDDSRACNVQACDTYAWRYGSWSTCSVACGGGGVASRVAQCWDVTSGTAADSSACTALGSPVTTESCGSAACPVYEYVYGNWSACSAQCGGGVATRTAACYDSVYGQWYDLSTCQAALGSATTSMTCNSAACPTTTYEWQWSAWGACPVACGGGVQSRQVACVSLQPYMPVAQSHCPAASMPATTQACGQKSCNIYSWSITPWGACSATCGGGQQTRAVYCQNFWTGALSAPSTCSQYMTSAEPATSQACNTAACPHALDPTPILPSTTNTSDSAWVVGEWSGCSAECGGGLQYRSVECGSSNTSLCVTASRPVEQAACNTALCPAVWHVSAWSSCSAECGGGWMNRSVQCVTSVGSEVDVVDSARCSALSRPSSNGECMFAPCPTWLYSGWSTCTAACGQGVTTRTAVCTRYDGVALSSDHCSQYALDSTSAVCEQQPCPHWHLGTWSDCDRPCGAEASQQRERTCRLPRTTQLEGMVVPPRQCTELSAEVVLAVDGPGASAEERAAATVGYMPPTSRTCEAQSCPAYYWNAIPAGVCSADCGGGVEQLSVGCYSGATGDEVDPANCLQSGRPQSSRPCNVGACDGPQWVASGWSNCTAVCGSGSQSRTATCRSSDGALMDDSACELSSLPSLFQSCTVDARACWGVGVLPSELDAVVAGAAVNGVCSLPAARCVCRPGYSGAYCEVAPSVQFVSLHQSELVAGDVLLIEWSTVGDIPYVSISLRPLPTNDSSSAAYYSDDAYSVAVDVLNYGEWTWTVPVSLSAYQSYSVRVSYSADVYGDSAAVRVVESACAVVECGEHGTCGVSGQCTCSAGWSGSDCSVSPCDSLRCNWAHANECNALSWLAGSGSYSTAGQQCSCLDGWSGPLCATPPQCASELVCANGGDTDLSTVFVDYSGATDAHYCGRCKCTGRWQGTTCEVCPITCAAGGVVDEQCTRCDCPDGYYGAACQSRYYELTMQLDAGEAATRDILVSTARLRRLEQSAASELASAAGFAALTSLISVAVTAEPSRDSTHIQLSTRLAYSSVLVSSFDVGQSLLPSVGLSDGAGSGAIASVNPASLTAYRLQPAVQQSNRTAARTLLQALTTLMQMMSEADSILYRGDVLSQLDTAAGVQVVDPTGQDSLALQALTATPPVPTSRFVADPALIPASKPTQANSTSTAGATASATGTTGVSTSTTPITSHGSTGSHTAAVVVGLLVAAGVLAVVVGLVCGRYRSKLACLACPVVVMPAALSLTASVSAPAATSTTSTTADTSMRVPDASELEMVQSANSDMPELEYYQRSISDSSVAYQLHRSLSSPEPIGDGYAMHDHDDDSEPQPHCAQMRRSTSMDELPSPPSLSPQISSA